MQTTILRCEWLLRALRKAVLNKIRAESLGESPKSTVDGEIGAEDILALKGRDHLRTR